MKLRIELSDDFMSKNPDLFLIHHACIPGAPYMPTMTPSCLQCYLMECAQTCCISPVHINYYGFQKPWNTVFWQ